jgi:hypothetical protein
MNEPTVFKCNTRIWFTFSLTLVVFFSSAYISFIVEQQGSLFKGLAILFCGILMCTFSVLISINQQSDLVINDQSISKSLFGKTWRSVEWKNVREIHIGLVPRFSKPPVKCCWIYPSLESRSGTKCGVISIGYERKDIVALLEVINHYISKYDIKIQSRIPGDGTFITRLTT